MYAIQVSNKLYKIHEIQYQMNGNEDLVSLNHDMLN